MNENINIDSIENYDYNETLNWISNNKTESVYNNPNNNAEYKNYTNLNNLIISPLKNTLDSITTTAKSLSLSASIHLLNDSNNNNSLYVNNANNNNNNNNNNSNSNNNFFNINDNNNNNTNYNNNFNNYSEIINAIESINDIFRYYYIPILIFTGSIGNILSVFVFFKTKLKKLSSSYYLAALAVSDTLFLIFVFIQWLNNFDINLYNRDGLCQLLTFFTTLCSFLSVWFVVAFTVERFIAVMYPLKRQTMCTVRRAKIVLIGLTLTATAHSLPYLFFASPIYESSTNSMICDFKMEYKEYLTILNYIDTIVVFAVPFTTIVILNTFTGCTVWKFATVRRTMTTHKRKPQIAAKAQFTTTFRTLSSSSIRNHIESTSNSTTTKLTNCTHPNGRNSIRCNGSKTGRKKLTNSSQIKVTKMLLIVSTVFVCLNLPSYVMRVRSYIVTATKIELNIQYLFWFIFLTNFGINFVLYCVSGQNFRHAVISMFRKATSSNQRECITQVTVSEYIKGSTSTGAPRRRTLTHNGSWSDMHELKQVGSIKLK